MSCLYHNACFVYLRMQILYSMVHMLLHFWYSVQVNNPLYRQLNIFIRLIENIKL